MGHDKRERCRGHPLYPRRLTERCWLHQRKACAQLIGEAAHGPIIELGGYQRVLLAAERLNIALLTVQIDRIFGVDLDLLRHGRRNRRKLRPDR